MGDMKNAYKTLVVKLKGKREFGRTKRRWKGNISLYLGEVGCEGVDWIHLTQDRTSGGLL
jgi:hypothetical protein